MSQQQNSAVVGILLHCTREASKRESEQVSHSTECVQVPSSHQHTDDCSTPYHQDRSSCHHIERYTDEPLHNRSISHYALPPISLRRFYPRDAMLARVLAMAPCPCQSVSVCHSQCSIKRDERINLISAWGLLSTSRTLRFKAIQVFLQK